MSKHIKGAIAAALSKPYQTGLAMFAVVAVGMLTAGALAMTPQPIAWSYKPLRGMCELEAAAAVDGVRAAVPLGQTVQTMFGTWSCVAVIAQQAPVEIGGAWVRQNK